MYSSFLQRAYDQILHDVCIQNLHVVFAIDRAGLVGSDGETHQGIFDLSYLSSIPNMTIMAPKNKWELSDMMKFAVNFDRPIALRYPRGAAYDGLREYRHPIEYGKSEILFEESDIDVYKRQELPVLRPGRSDSIPVTAPPPPSPSRCPHTPALSPHPPKPK